MKKLDIIVVAAFCAFCGFALIYDHAGTFLIAAGLVVVIIWNIIEWLAPALGIAAIIWFASETIRQIVREELRRERRND